jgi:hypothetical protein
MRFLLLRASIVPKETSMEWTGGCLCGAVRFRAAADPIRVVSCHCGQCRRHSGAAFLTFVHFPVGPFEWLGATPTRFRSSPDAERGFCPHCGSTLSMHEAVLPDRVQVTLGSLDEPGRVRPDEVWTESQLPSLKIDDDRPRFRRSSTAVPSRAERS